MTLILGAPWTDYVLHLESLVCCTLEGLRGDMCNLYKLTKMAAVILAERSSGS
jgi:hypothetical protein